MTLDLTNWPDLTGLKEVPWSDVPRGELAVIVYDHSDEVGTTPYRSIIMFHKGSKKNTMGWYAEPGAGGTCYIADPDATQDDQPAAELDDPLPHYGYGKIRGDESGKPVALARYRDGYLDNTLREADETRLYSLDEIEDFTPDTTADPFRQRKLMSVK